MALVEIFRFEDECGTGMYYTNTNANDVFEWDTVNHPVPNEDSLLMSNLSEKTGSCSIKKIHKFGFSSMEQLRRWLYQDQWLIGLNRIGIKLAIYLCDEDSVVVGHTQSIFDDYLKKDQYNILEYFGLNP